MYYPVRCCFTMSLPPPPISITIHPITEKTKLEYIGKENRGLSSLKTARRLEVRSPVPADIDIANSVEPLPIADIADSLNVQPNHYDLYGKYKAKVLLSVLDELQGYEDGYYVVVGGITPTPLGEGKSTAAVGLCQALGAFLDNKHAKQLQQKNKEALKEGNPRLKFTAKGINKATTIKAKCQKLLTMRTESNKGAAESGGLQLHPPKKKKVCPPLKQGCGRESLPAEDEITMC